MNENKASVHTEFNKFPTNFGLKIVAIFELSIALISFACLTIIIHFWVTAPAIGNESALQQLFYRNLGFLNSIGFIVVIIARVMTLPTATWESLGSGGSALYLSLMFFLIFLILGFLGLAAGLGLVFKKIWAIEVSMVFTMYFSILGLYWISLIGVLSFFILYKHRPKELKTINWINDKLKILIVGFSENDTLYWLNRGIFLFQAKEFSNAEQALRKALTYSPDEIEAWYNLGLVLKEQYQHSEAETAFKQVISRHTTDFIAWYQLGNMLYAQYKVKQAKEAWHLAVTYSPEDWIERANLEQRLKRELNRLSI